MTSRNRWALALIAVVVVAITLGRGWSADDTDDTEGSSADESVIEVRDVSIPPPAGANGALYLTLDNSGDRDDTLVAAHLDVGERIEIHQTTAGTDGLMRMERLDGIEVPAGEIVVLQPGGFHIMIMGIDRLVEGQVIELELEFELAGTVTVEAVVRNYVEILDG